MGDVDLDNILVFVTSYPEGNIELVFIAKEIADKVNKKEYYYVGTLKQILEKLKGNGGEYWFVR